MSNPLTNLVTLNLFQGPSRPADRTVLVERWMLKQVQQDDEGNGRA